jgi:hypothetical protein
MANNRLYIGNKETKQYVLLSKSMGGGWSGVFNPDKFEYFLNDQTDEGFLGGSTNLVLFTEYDEIYDDFRQNGIVIDVTLSQEQNLK